MVSRPDIDKGLQSVRELMQRDLGVSEMPIDDDSVPAHLKDLIPLATMFGITDDGTREEAVEMMPKDFIAYADRRITGRAEVVREWLLEGDQLEENKMVFTSLLQAFERRRRRWVAPTPISDELGALVDMAIRAPRGN